MRAINVIAFILSAASFAGPAMPAEYKDSDWNTTLVNTCRLPCSTETSSTRPASVQWQDTAQGKALAISLAPGDVGGCQSDTSPRDGALYWERAELTNPIVMEHGSRTLISFAMTFDRGFAGKRETFFQIHGWSPDCASAPLAMLSFDWRSLQVRVLKPSSPEFGKQDARGDLQQVLKDKPRLSDLTRRVNVYVQFDRSGTGATLTVILNGKPLVQNEPVYMQACAQPRFKVGIYRPGGINPGLSRLLLDKLQVTGANEPTCAPGISLDELEAHISELPPMPTH